MTRLVYLDNNDYSRLSDRTVNGKGFDIVLQKLLGAASERKAIFCFSGTLLSEMSPLAPAYSDAANRRAEMVVQLCGRNALISTDRLVDGEIRFLIGQANSLPSVYSPAGDWYPDSINAFSPVRELELASQVRDSIKSLAPNRKARRFAERRALKAGRISPPIREILVDGARKGALDEILRSYPMRPDDARVLARFAVGDATVAEAQAAFVETLRDPRWMMSWFEKHHDQLNPFITRVRAPARSMAESMRELATRLQTLRAQARRAETRQTTLDFDAPQWSRWQDQLLVGLATRLARQSLASEPPSISAASVDERCPGLSVGVRSLLSAWRSALTETTPRPPKDSDFLDAVHAMYAPYVQIFRADAFMAPHVRKFAERFGTTIVSKLEELPLALDC